MSLAILPSKPQAPVTYKLSTSSVKPSILTYDSYIPGATPSQDSVDNIPGKYFGYSHDFNDAVSDLHEPIQVTALTNSKLVLVAAIIVVYIARLYAHKHSATMEGLLFLGSNIGNAEATDLWPNPHTPDFKESDVSGDDCTLEHYIEVYATSGQTFITDVNSSEGRNAEGVKDSQKFQEEVYSTCMAKINEALFRHTGSDLSTNKVLAAPNYGHSIQNDDPQFVVTQLEDLPSRIQI
ncbi:hypothetical protein BHYA_0047g00150 [Botrytis hyacinthi]|uniref:Uncharacterized protein n=1 Tax=Botrytis hyacinthi TaxID=278943 RepID=A0A4Z1GXE5_9HELO|nr:hypothetical protein BHYA_0047g00150 [Botrytis hyacinthi]